MLKDTPELRELVACLADLHEAAVVAMMNAETEELFEAREKANAIYNAGAMLIEKVDKKDAAELSRHYEAQVAANSRNTFFYKRGGK